MWAAKAVTARRWLMWSSLAIGRRWWPAQHCIRCHDRENSPQFGFDEYWALIEHGVRTTAATSSANGEVTQ